MILSLNVSLRITLPILATTAALLWAHSLPAQQADDITGVWLTGEGRSKVQIYKEGSTYSGKVIWLKEPRDESGQPKLADNGKPVMDMQIMRGFVFEDGEWVDGTIYDPESGNTYYASMELESPNELDLRGSVDPMGWLGRTETWSRVP